MSNPPPTPAERFATCLLWLSKAVVAMMGGDRLPLLLIAQIVDRIRGIKQRFAILAALIAAGKYVPRQNAAPPQKRPGQAPPPKNPLPNTFGWLLKLVPEAVQYRGQLEILLQDPEMAALIAAAPGSLRRPLRSLCWMLHLTPPAILAPPPPPPRPKPPPPPRIPRENPERGFSPSRPMGRVRYVFGLRYPSPFKNPP